MAEHDMTEIVARAICCPGGCFGALVEGGAGCAAGPDFLKAARAAITAHLSALTAAGYVVVPRVPTEAMVKAAAFADFKSFKGSANTAAIFAAMLSVAPASPTHPDERRERAT